MKYNERMVDAVAGELKRRLQKNEIDRTYAVATLFILEETGRTNEDDTMRILEHIFPDPFDRVGTVLMAGNVLDDQMLADIIDDVNDTTSRLLKEKE